MLKIKIISRINFSFEDKFFISSRKPKIEKNNVEEIIKKKSVLKSCFSIE
jgi:hypothetical protein